MSEQELKDEIAELRASLTEIAAGYAMGNAVLASMLIAFLDERGIVSAEELQERIRIELGPIERAELPRHAVTAMLLQIHDLLDRRAFERWKPADAANSDGPD